MGIVRRERFFNAVKRNKRPAKKVKYATIDPAYTSGLPRLIFDGEVDVTLKAYPYLGTYTPVAGHRVRVDDGVVMGNIVSE